MKIEYVAIPQTVHIISPKLNFERDSNDMYNETRPIQHYWPVKEQYLQWGGPLVPRDDEFSPIPSGFQSNTAGQI